MNAQGRGERGKKGGEKQGRVSYQSRGGMGGGDQETPKKLAQYVGGRGNFWGPRCSCGRERGTKGKREGRERQVRVVVPSIRCGKSPVRVQS